MKKSFLLLLTVLCISVVYAQTSVILSFEINQNGSQLLLDSVLIENTTNSTDTTICYPDTSLEIDILSGIGDNDFDGDKLFVKQNYPNPFDDNTYIEVFTPEKMLEVSITDYSGKQLLSKSFIAEKGLNKFVFTAGADSQYLVNFSCAGYKQTIKLLSIGKAKTELNIDLIDSDNRLSLKTLKNTVFTYTEGDNLSFTSYATACSEVETAFENASPTENATITFDYTSLTNIQPDRPERIPAIVTETGISWNWSEVNDADGYKYNTVNDFETATDIGTLTELDWSELNAGNNYELYVWAYNDCGKSFPLHIVEATTALPFTADENNLVISGAAGEEMSVMYICQQPDSVVLRTTSTNVNLEEENLELLKDRMKTTVLGEGVGIAAPQVGINRNVIWVQRYDKGSAIVKPWEVYFNPVITAYSDTVALRNDGCLSVPDDCVSEYSIAGNSYRSIWVDVQYYDIDGNFVQERITHQFTAHIFQHEIDHLNGIMFFDRQIEEIPGKYVIIEGDSYDGLPKID